MPPRRRSGSHRGPLLAFRLWCAATLAALSGLAGADEAISDAEAASRPGPPSLVTALEAAPGQSVRFTITNRGSGVATVSLRDTPFDPFQPAASLSVDRPVKGWPPMERAHYVGRLAKRLPPGPDELVELVPGQRLSTTVALDGRFGVATLARHRIALAHPVRAAAGERASVIVRSRARGERLDKNFTPVPVPPAISMALAPTAAPIRRVRPPTFENCNERQQVDIGRAATLAESLAAAALEDLDGLAPNERLDSPRYRTWFGPYDDARFVDVRTDVSAVVSALADRRIGFDCACDEAGVYAYVFPARPYEIYLCPVFWSTSLEGSDSRAGTLIHELSHFDAVAGTDDHVYTQGRARSLARTDPALAIDNADSFEYFIEDSPPLPIRAAPGTTMTGGTDELRDDAASAGDRLAVAFGAPSRGVLQQGDALRFAVDGAREVRLESIGGDADLFVFDGLEPDSERLLCASVLTPEVSTVDRCDVAADGAMTAVVVGYTATEFLLSVDGPANDDGRGVTVADDRSTRLGALSVCWLVVGALTLARVWARQRAQRPVDRRRARSG